jgi:rhodanese-related sulfurtransferase
MTTPISRNLLLLVRTVAALSLFLPLIALATACASGFKTVSVQEAHNLIQQTPDIVILDVRTREEFASPTGHLKNAVLIPVQELEARIGELQAYKSRPILVYCRSGSRSARASELLTKQGFAPINVAGGIMEWNAGNLPTER